MKNDMNPLKPFNIPLSGINLIEASAGTGKTYNITSLYVRTLIEKPITVDQVLVMTFTKAATKELKDRLLNRLQESIDALEKQESGDDEFLDNLINHVQKSDEAVHKLQQAVHSFDKAGVYTIHGFCQQVLQQYTFESGSSYSSEVISDDRELIQELIDDYWRNWVAEMSKDPLKTPLLKLINDIYSAPDKLFDEIGSIDHLAYKRIQPEKVEIPKIDEKLKLFRAYFADLQKLWQKERGHLLSLLSGKEMSNYRSNWLTSWSNKMDRIFIQDVATIDLFDQFVRFTQKRIDNGLKKKYNKKGTDAPKHDFFKIADKYLTLAEELQNYQQYFELQVLAYLQKKLPVKKERLGLISYSDQLTLIQKALQGDQGDRLASVLRKNYPIALVDEYQDTDPIQYDIFQSIYSGADNEIAFFMIGDPKQSIYGFRGADIFSYLQARGSVQDENVYSLSCNYRSVPQLIEANNVFWSQSQTPFVIGDIEFAQVEAGKDEKDYEQLKEHDNTYPPVHFRKLSKSIADRENKGEAGVWAAKDTAGEILRLLQDGRVGKIKIGDRDVTGRDIAVLVRKHDQADIVREELQKKGIKSVQISDRSVFKSDEADQLVYILQAIISPSNDRLVKTAMATPIIGYRPQEMLQIEEQPEKWVDILDFFTDLHRTWQKKGFAAMFGRFMKHGDVAERLIGLFNGERRLTNILHLAELLQDEEQQHEGMWSLLKWMMHKREDDQKSAEQEQLRLESDEELVKVVTMHSSKGLEFPIVFCPFLWQGPHIRDKGQVLEYHDDGEAILDFNGKNDENRTEKRQMARREQLAEDMRLAYVAMTRAEHRCYLTWCYANSCEFSSLGYLLYGADKSIDALNHKIKGGFKGLGNEAADKAINTLPEDYPKLFTCESIPRNEQDTLDLFETSAAELQPVRTFTRETPLPAGEAVASFSSLIRMSDSDPDIPDYDQFLFNPEENESKTAHQNDMFGFPKGAGPGTCLHKIFEEIDFADKRTFHSVVADNLLLYGMSEKWKEVAEKMLETTLHKKLLESEPELSLSSIQPDQFIREMEFYYKSSNVETTELFSIIRGNGNSRAWPQNKTAKGFLKGFIDLTFEFKGKFYLLDYKSNYLGNTYEDYNEETLRDEMIVSSYDLQYHIYTIALHRYLKNKVPDYSYEKHFGGAFYLFLRGINNKNQNGVFFDRPGVKTIQQLDNYLLNGVKA